MTELGKAALEIMALVDEYPSEPFSLERKWLLEKLEAKLVWAWDAFEDEADANYQVGYDVGYSDGHDEGKAEMEDELESRIQDLEDQVNDLETEIEDMQTKIDQAFTEGFEIGARNPDADSIEIRQGR